MKKQANRKKSFEMRLGEKKSNLATDNDILNDGCSD